MNSEEVASLVRAQLGAAKDLPPATVAQATDWLLQPKPIRVIERSVRNDEFLDSTVTVWLVLKESPGEGYRIVFDDTDGRFALATPGFPQDAHLILCGWYRDFVTAFLGM